jgi:hypothetical protein
MYSENPAGVDPYTYAITATQRCGNYVAEGDCYNRAYYTTIHFNSASPMVSDAHFITQQTEK